MVDITLEIILEPATHDLSYDPEKAARRYRRGDIFEVHRSTDIATLTNGVYHLPSIGTTVFGYIHIRGVPNARARRMREVLTQDTGETKTVSSIDPETRLFEDIEVLDNYRKRRWRIPRSVIPPTARTRLLADREITVDWTTFRDRIRRKIIANRLDVSRDDESNAIADTDLP